MMGPEGLKNAAANVSNVHNVCASEHHHEGFAEKKNSVFFFFFFFFLVFFTLFASLSGIATCADFNELHYFGPVMSVCTKLRFSFLVFFNTYRLCSAPTTWPRSSRDIIPSCSGKYIE